MLVALPYLRLKGPAVREGPRIVHTGEVRLEIHRAPVLCSVPPAERRVLVEKRLPRGDSLPHRIPGDLEGSIFREPHVLLDIPNREVLAHRRCEKRPKHSEEVGGVFIDERVTLRKAKVEPMALYYRPQ